ncbi:M3 family oligoendopeptidase [Murimonas intestini]|uniref:M3 family oligoendopeptidase n=1 Tax=Murimonas intestini TaxID=1337051 RepID=A0AB73T9I7_9FIRM|nr:M3 family oligoendopeptidase [Murimonas intestini]MCR1839298.1 M3 family oligoendopeptidase [Murimonas intestini]MCR1864593.1 M3 family oligoendopeptidase [Murimonas intestini]MCR1882203.1 M3 family oligoendopeptidase [Murimonas intestini]
MQKFSEIVYERPDTNAFMGKIEEYMEKLPLAGSYEEAKELFLWMNSEADHLDTMNTVASIRNTINTADEFYEKEVEFMNSELPKIQLKMKEANKLLLESPWLSEFEKDFGELYFLNIKNRMRLADEKIIQNQIRESQLTQQYAKASAVCTATFHGEEVNFYGLLKYMQSTDRAVRKEAFEAWAGLYESVSGELDKIYDELIKVRCEMAEVLGFSDYIEMAYLQRERYDYKKEDVAVFRKQIEETVVPVCRRLFEEQRERLGIETLHYYDEALVYPEGNAVPSGTKDEMIEKAGKMYHELSHETGEFFDFMVCNDLFDLETKPGKRQGGYCTFLADYKAPFIFSNFNQTSADVDVLTHEAGHAFEAYIASRLLPLSEQSWSTSEIDEIHSMSMEFFTYPWMELFFGGDADKYRYAHLADALEVIPYMACVDEFQHEVYEGRVTDAKERRNIWSRLEKKYLPWRDYDGNDFLENGGFWMQKQHIFLFPFYYIDYALAQMGALELYGRMKENREEAWNDYCRLCRAGGSKGYFELLKEAHLSNPFAGGTVEKIMGQIKKEL